MNDQWSGNRAAWEGEMYRLLAENVREYAIFLVDCEGNVQTWTAGAERLLGYREAEIVGQSAHRFFTPEDVEAGIPEQELREALKTGRGEDDRWHVRKDGSRFWSAGVVTPLRNRDGTLQGYAKIMRDQTEAKQLEMVLRASEARVRGVIQSNMIGIGFWDSEGYVTEANDLLLEMIGYTRDDVAARRLRWPELTPPEYREVDARAVAQTRAVGWCTPYEKQWIRRDGSRIPILIGGAHFEGDPDHGSFWVLDITERKHAEEALRQSEERFRGVIEQAPFSIQLFAADGRTIRVNRAWEQLWGVQLEQVAEYNILQDGQLEAKGILPYIRRAFAGETVTIPAIEYDPNETIPDRTRYKDARRWVAAVAYPLKNIDGEVQEVVLLHEDITARKRAEEALLAAHRELEQRVAERTAELSDTNDFLQALLENVQDGIVACDAEGRLTLFNRATREFHDAPDEQLSADQWPRRYDLYGADGKTLMTKEQVPLFRALQGERVHNVEMVIARKNAPPRTLLASGQAFYDSQGNKLGAVVSMHDITQRKQAEEALRKAHEQLERRVSERTAELAKANRALREADRRKDEFLAMLSHELRNPLAPIRIGLELLALNDPASEIIEPMQQQVEHLVRLVDDLLDVSRIMRGKVELRKEPVLLEDVMTRAVDTVRAMLEARQQRFSVTLPPDDIWLQADAVRLAQVVSNLLNNASKYTDVGGRITVEASREEDVVVIRVEDTGQGIEPELLPHVFDLFTQSARTIDRSQGGLGIGLTVVKSLVEMHHGTVQARSQGLGAGSEFTVRLPVLRSHGASSAGQGAHEPSVDYRLLVVDDNAAAANMLALLLKKLGDHQVTVVYDGPAALAAARRQRPDIILLDIGLPQMDGYEVARQLRQDPQFETTLIVALTGYGTESDRRKSLHAGCDEHLVKPPGVEAIRKLLSHPKLQ